MFGFKFINKLSSILFFLSVSSLAVAVPFVVTFSDTIGLDSSTPPFNAGEALTISIVLDNGGTTTASQTWTATDAVSITFDFNDDTNTITTVYSAAALYENTGGFVTDAGGVLIAVPSNWTSTSPTIIATNDPGTPIGAFFINGFNSVYSNAAGDAYMTNVANNIIPAFWKIPAVPAAPAKPVSATPVPTMSAYGLVLTMLGLLVVAARRLRTSAKSK